MRRIWRFILALSVTPLMTAACLAILAWMTWNAALEDRFGSSQWHVGKVVNWLQESTLRYLPGWPPEVYRRGAPPQVFVVIEDGSGLRRVDGDSIDDPTATCVILTTDAEPIARYGMFAITSEWWRTSATLMQGGTQVVSPKLSARIAEKMKHDRGLSMYANTVLKSKGRVPTVVWSGYMYNTIAVVVAALCAYSVQWIWRGARWPWGANRAWKVAADRPAVWWWARRVMLFSPFGTVTTLTVLCWLMVTMWSPQTQSQESLQRSLHHAMYPIDLDQCDDRKMFSLYVVITPSLGQPYMSNLPWLFDGEKRRWSSLGVDIPASDHRQPAIFAPMLSASHPVVIIHGSTEEEPRIVEMKKEVETLMIDRGVITPEQAPLLWTVQPKRIVWQGVLFNSIMLAVAGAFFASLLWLRDGVVWPWNARRLRQGLCHKCGYSLSGLSAAKCPECGTQVPSLA